MRASDADRALTAMYSTEYGALVRMSAILLGDVGSAEEVVQDCFVTMFGAWRRLRDSDKALSYLRQSVVNRSRSVLRHRAVANRNAPDPAPDMPSAEQSAITRLERLAVLAALRSLSPRQRQALVLRYYLDLTEEEVAAAMKISPGGEEPHRPGQGSPAQRAGTGAVNYRDPCGSAGGAAGRDTSPARSASARVRKAPVIPRP